MEQTLFAKTIPQNAWFKQWFDSSFYHQLYANRDEQEAASFIDELVAELQPLPSSQMLDLGCGNGRHSRQLAAKGFDVTGIDIASSSIRHANKSATSRLRFYRQDMRQPFGKNSFDYVFNFFTSFGYFNDPCDDNAVISNIAQSLKPGGVLVMDYINAAYAEQRLVAKEVKEIDGILYHISRRADDNRIYKKILIEQPTGNPMIYTEQVSKFKLEDFKSLFHSNGLEITDVFGDYHLNSFNNQTSPRIILIAKKINHATNNN